ncbi:MULTISPECIES: hypothetical protein [Xanthomonas]|uniref:Uncharacterized protein n=1 Tax=Xanthomonas manihotis TaxID=43353 RepID=A0A8I2BUX3_XANMN|nr:hypothetical protein [Xanthomonas phaseoli]MBO9722471.1 hypothetical protein [Xanthomonas phaseoli pv. manihotis]MBO9759717.1 hypothetical protein [Xanthomonas phaseoli pv. manihotis]MBO9783401.1 hypothetical protein [Xanthomonas phaseoli pv. manihotis]
MARLAESSVVIAFRDWQWLNRTADATVPPLMIVMEGNPESMLGDLQISAGERFFLFEVKSTEDTICEEWNKWDYKKQIPKPKVLFTKHCQILDDLGKSYSANGTVKNAATLEEALNFINFSIACHHFLYWNEVTSHFQIEPYYFGCERKNGLSTAQLKKCQIAINKLSFALNELDTNELGASLSPPSQDDSLPIYYTSIRFIQPEMLNDRSARLITEANSKNPLWQFLGLPFEEFDSYVQQLCGGTSYKTNCVLLSSSGKIFAHIVDTIDLLTLIKAIRPRMLPDAPDPNSSPSGAKKHIHRATRRPQADKPKPDPSLNGKPKQKSSGLS